MVSILGDESKDVGRASLQLAAFVKVLQKGVSAVEKCRLPVIAVVGGYALGGAIDLLLACDVVFASADAIFSIREVRIGMAADLGTLQRMPLMTANWSRMKELAYTGDDFSAQEAKEMGLVGGVLRDKAEAEARAIALAQKIAEQSPLAVQGTKQYMDEFKNGVVRDGLRSIRTHNKSALNTKDMELAFVSVFEKSKPVFPKL